MSDELRLGTLGDDSSDQLRLGTLGDEESSNLRLGTLGYGEDAPVLNGGPSIPLGDPIIPSAENSAATVPIPELFF